jgi:hypothetical protein
MVMLYRILTGTISAQDFPDVEGDAASGRVTFPLYAPELSRVFTFFAIVVWSVGLGWYWAIGPTIQGTFILLGAYVGFRYYKWRTPAIDKRSYLMFNVGYLIADSLPYTDLCLKRFGLSAHICSRCMYD